MVTIADTLVRKSVRIVGGDDCSEFEMKIHRLSVAAALASLKSGLAGLSDAEAHRWLPLPIIQILAVDLGDMLPGPPTRQAKYEKGWAINALSRWCRWPSVDSLAAVHPRPIGGITPLKKLISSSEVLASVHGDSGGREVCADVFASWVCKIRHSISELLKSSA